MGYRVAVLKLINRKLIGVKVKVEKLPVTVGFSGTQLCSVGIRAQSRSSEETLGQSLALLLARIFLLVHLMHFSFQSTLK